MMIEDEEIELVTNEDYMWHPDGSVHRRVDLFTYINGSQVEANLGEWEADRYDS